MTNPRFIVRALDNEPRAGFSCGVKPLDQYFHTQVTQDIKRRVAMCYVAIERETETIAGFYTLSACHLNLSILGDDWRKKLPRYPTVPSARLGRLAIDKKYQSQRLGGALLYDAANRAYTSEIAAAMFVVDAKDETAARFYQHHGFRRDPVEQMRLFAPLKSLIMQ